MKKKPSPRDNVIFELGLFMGALTRTRTFVLAPSQVDLKIPSDLLGVTFLRYARRGGSIGQRMSEPLKALRKHMRKYGPREVLGAP
jgi:predicted nucleotide-binding protein